MLLTWACSRRGQQKNMAFAITSVWEKAAPSALVLKQFSSFPYALGFFQAAVVVLELRDSESE